MRAYTIFLLTIVLLRGALHSIQGQSCIEMQCPSNIVVRCDRPGGAVVDFTVSATNHCGREWTVTCDPPSGSLFPAGLTTVLCTAQGGTNTAWCSFLVEVLDDTPPVIDCPDDIVAAAQGVDGAMVRWTVAAMDDCDTNVLVVCDPPSGSFFPLGTTVVRCLATDDSGNSALCGFRVTVREERPLSIALNSPSNAVIRWHVPGILEVARSLSPPDWRPAGGSVITNREERTLLRPLDLPGQFFRVAAAPLAPPRDQDGDGVPDGRDRCPGSPSRANVDAHGCSILGLAAFPEQVAGPGLERLGEMRGWWRDYPGLDTFGTQLEERIGALHVALAWIRQGRLTDPSEPLGLERFSQAVEGLRALQRDLLDLIATRERELLADLPDLQDYADTTPQSSAYQALLLHAGLFSNALSEIESTEEALLELKRTRTGQSTVRGVIAEINDAQRMIELVDGRRVGLAEGQVDALLTVGADVEFEAQTFADGSALAHAVALPRLATASIIFPEIRCLFLRIVPVQPLPPYFSTTPTLHHPDAYDHDGLLLLEGGMRLAAVDGNCPATFVPPDTLVTTRMKLDLLYQPIGGSYQTVTLATSLGVGSEPVPFPPDISSSEAELTVTTFRQECPAIGLPGSCFDPEELSVDTYSLRVYPRYNYAEAIYEATVFDLEDSPQEEGHRLTRVAGVELSTLPMSPEDVDFRAQGFTVTGAGLAMNYVSLNEDFAVHEWDFYDDPAIFFKEQTLGVTNRSALYWPRITGYHNARAFRYACRLPQLTRDAVSFCGDSPPTFYRLPFSGGWPTWSVSQGNFGTSSHTNDSAYAYDFAAPAGTLIRAARGGMVISVEESLSESTYDPDLQMCTSLAANRVYIRHQDGTIGQYGHMPQNGVLVAFGQKVRRGDPIALVGSTGCASGPHLHFEVRNVTGSFSIASRFERWNACFVPMYGTFLPCAPLLSCVVPDVGDFLFSTQ